MRKAILICMMATFTFLNGFSLNVFQQVDNDAGGALTITCTQDLAGLLNSIRDEYLALNPGFEFDIRVIDGDEYSKVDLSESFILAGEPVFADSGKEAWSLTIGRDVLVPVINKDNPNINELLENGVKPSSFRSLLNSGREYRWADLLASGSPGSLTIYMDKSEGGVERFADFAGLTRDQASSINIVQAEDLIARVSSDKNAIGFCRLNNLPGSEKHYFSGELRIMPIDCNENGKIDHYENFQAVYADFIRAVWIGKYPRSLFNEIRLVSANVPVDKATLSFIEWILTSGQEQLTAAGFTELIPGEARTTMSRIYAYEPELNVENSTYASVERAFLWILGFLGLVLLSGLVVLLASKKTVTELVEESVGHTLDTKRIKAPEGILFDKSFTWSYMEKDGMVKVGASDFLQHITGKVTRLIPKNAGESIKRGEPMFTIVQDGKHLVVYSPVSGTIENVNSELSADSSAINKSPYSEGWIYEVKPSKWMSEYRNFLMGETYKEWLSKEVVRLKEFMNNVIFKKYAPELQPILQDGGEVVDNLLEEMGPDMWEEFQLGFIDKAF